MIDNQIIDPIFHNTSPSHGKFKLDIRLGLSIQDVLLARHLEIICCFVLADNMLLQRRISGLCTLGLNLDSTAAVQKAKEEARFVYCAARG